MTNFHLNLESDWQTLLSFLPMGWEDQAKHLGAFSRKSRRFTNPGALLRVLLIHFSCGCSLRTTSAIARESNLANVSDVALLKRLKHSGEWFLWMAQEMRKSWFPISQEINCPTEYRMRLVDGTTVEEPGATGTTWKIHYSLSLDTLRCDEVHVTSPQTSECFTNFTIEKNDILFGDRGYCKSKGVAHVVGHGGQVILRLMSTTPLYSSSGTRIALLPLLKELQRGEVGEWSLSVQHGGTLIPCRICALKKSQVEIEKARKAILRKASRTGHKVREETLEFAEYIVVLTTLEASFEASRILNLYRLRWQVELAFKRLKSLLGLGHLRKADPAGARAWIHGKLFLAVLIEAFIRAGEAFFPWGYPALGKTAKSLA